MRTSGVEAIPIMIVGNCWLGAEVAALRGLHIPRQSSARTALLAKEIPSGWLAVGCPGRMVEMQDRMEPAPDRLWRQERIRATDDGPSAPRIARTLLRRGFCTDERHYRNQFCDSREFKQPAFSSCSDLPLAGIPSTPSVAMSFITKECMKCVHLLEVQPDRGQLA
ncbi:hypothetical protein GCM10028796_37710 [Ramlibacter monticola]